MLGLGHPPQHPGEALVAGTHATAVLPFLQERLQVVVDQQDTPAAQAVQQEVLAAFQARRRVRKRLGSKDLQAVIEQRFTARDIAQGTPDDDLEVLRHAVHHLRRQRRLANAPLAQHAHYPAALLHHPLPKQVKFPRAPIEAGHIWRVAPIDAWPTPGKRSERVGSDSDLLDLL